MLLGMIRGGRPLKRWRYVGLFGEQLMACAALVQVGPARQSFWALYERGERRLRQRTRLLPRRAALLLSPGLPCRRVRGSRLEPGRVRLRDGGVKLDLRLEEEPGIQALCTHGSGLVWTRKQAGVAARGTLALDGGRSSELTALAVIDDTAGYHARHTEWWWATGAASCGCPATHTARSEPVGGSLTPRTRFHAVASPPLLSPTPAAHHHSVCRAW